LTLKVFMSRCKVEVEAAGGLHDEHDRVVEHTDKHASYPETFATSVMERVLPFDCKLRRVKYLNNIIEQDNRAIRRRWRAMQCVRSFHTAERTLEGIEPLRTHPEVCRAAHA
jgi:transposase, IS6 family